MHDNNPFFELPYESALETLGGDFYDYVQPARFPKSILRFRNDDLLPLLGLAPEKVTDRHFEEAFCQFLSRSCSEPSREPLNLPLNCSLSQSQPSPLPQQTGMALRYHGYQFGQYNPYLGDGRGFLYGQVRVAANHLVDLGTKGSGQTPYSQGCDGRMTLLGGIREVLAAEALCGLGIPTSRILSLVETGEALTRAETDSPGRSAVMVRLSHSHIRFGTFERLEYFDRPDLIRQLLDHVIAYYYSHLWTSSNRDILFYAELVQRTASLVAQWMAAGFCHGVLNTDNMSIVGEGFDYGPYAFIETYNPYFTAASFDQKGRYSYRNQPSACRWNLEMLQRPLALVMSRSEMENALASFPEIYEKAYHRELLKKLGFQSPLTDESLAKEDAEALIQLTLELLLKTQVNYHHFFQAIQQQFCPQWREDPTMILADLSLLTSARQANCSASSFADVLRPWKRLYYKLLRQQPAAEMVAIAQRLKRHNLRTTLSQPMIGAIDRAIEQANNWQPFADVIASLQHSI